MENVTDKVSDVTNRAGAAVSDTGSWIVQLVRDNPVAFALIGAGLGALAINLRKRPQPPYRPGYRDSQRHYSERDYGPGY